MTDMPEMPQEYKDKWLAALRSGEYKQGFSVLYTPEDHSYCCLGVLQQVLAGEVEAKSPGFFKAMPSSEFYKQWEIAGFEQHAGPAGQAGTAYTLAEMNDGSVAAEAPQTFEQIADWIEENVKGV